LYQSELVVRESVWIECTGAGVKEGVESLEENDLEAGLGVESDQTAGNHFLVFCNKQKNIYRNAGSACR
jgi:hypothetical protein